MTNVPGEIIITGNLNFQFVDPTNIKVRQFSGQLAAWKSGTIVAKNTAPHPSLAIQSPVVTTLKSCLQFPRKLIVFQWDGKWNHSYQLSDNDFANKFSDFFIRKTATVRETIIKNGSSMSDTIAMTLNLNFTTKFVLP